MPGNMTDHQASSSPRKRRRLEYHSSQEAISSLTRGQEPREVLQSQIPIGPGMVNSSNCMPMYAISEHNDPMQMLNLIAGSNNQASRWGVVNGSLVMIPSQSQRAYRNDNLLSPPMINGAGLMNSSAPLPIDSRLQRIQSSLFAPHRGLHPNLAGGQNSTALSLLLQDYALSHLTTSLTSQYSAEPNVSSLMTPPRPIADSLVQRKSLPPPALASLGAQTSMSSNRLASNKVQLSKVAAEKSEKISKSKSEMPTARQLLPNDTKHIQHFSQRECIPLSTDEDQNWLSEFLCFVRADLVEIFRASKEDVRSRNSSKKVTLGQVGIRCRYCAHLPQSVRTSRSSSYPSSLSRIYQSLTMMLRDHFGLCNSIPIHLKHRFLSLKGKTSQGAADSKHFWVYSARKLGLVDSESGICIIENEDSDISTSVSYSTIREAHGGKRETNDSSKTGGVPLVKPEDCDLVSKFTYKLLTHAQLVHMEESERNGNRKSFPIGLPGIGCRHCCQGNWKGLCRLFPARRRTLPGKINDLYEHIRRCTLCPDESKKELYLLKNLETSQNDKKAKLVNEKEFYDRVWSRLQLGSFPTSKAERS